MKRILTIMAMVAVLAIAPAALGQGVLINLPPITNSQGQPIAGVTVSVFTASGQAPTLTCGTPVTVYKDVALSVPFSPLVTDGFGNFPFYINPSTNPYGYTVSGQNTNSTICYGFSAQIVPNSSPTFASATITGALMAGSVNNVIKADQQTGADSCAKITAAITALPTTGGIVDATGFQGILTACTSGGITLGSSTKPVTLLLGTHTLQMGANTLTVPCQSKIIGLGSTIATPISKITFSGLGGTTDAVTVQFCSTTNNEVAAAILGVGIDCGSSGQDCVRYQGGRGWKFQGNIFNSGRDGLVIGGTAASQFTEGAEVEAYILNSGRNNVRLDTTAGASCFINHVTWKNLHLQGAAGNPIRVEVNVTDPSQGGIQFQNFINFQSLQTSASAAADEIFINGGGGGSQAIWWNFVGGEHESTQSGVTTGFIINAANANVAKDFTFTQSFLDTRYGQVNSGTPFASNVTNVHQITDTGSFSGIDLIAGTNFRLFGASGATWTVSHPSAGTFQAQSNFGASGVFLVNHNSVATSGANFSSPISRVAGSCWNGSAGTAANWGFQNVIGAGSNPTETLTLTHVGCSGTLAIDFSGNGQFKVSQLNATVATGTAPFVVASTTPVANLVAGGNTVTIASGTAAMTTGLINAGACGSTVTVVATNVATTDAITWAFNAAPAANPAELVVSAWPTSGNVNFQYCNPTAGGVTPNAATLNWRVVR